MDNAALPEKITTVSIGKDRFKTTIKSEDHLLLADEPVSAGGTGQGFNPFSLLLASLGSCGAITVRMYADRKEWPLNMLEIDLSMEIIHLNGIETRQIIKNVRLYGPLSEEQKNRLMEIIDKCPVQKIISGEISFKTNLVN